MKDKIKQHLKKKYPSMNHDDTFIDSRVEMINNCIQDLGLSNEWVSVDDGLPCDGDAVLVYLNGMEWITEMYTDDSDGFRYFDDFEDKPPTHWQPLPLPPKESGE